MICKLKKDSKVIKFFVGRIFLALTFAAFLTSADAESENAANLIVNGNFEAPSNPGAIPGWKILGDPRFATVMSEEGNHFGRIQMTELGYCGIVQRFEVGKDWSGIEVSARIRASNLKQGPESHNTATFLYTFEDAEGQHVGSWTQQMVMKDQDWTAVRDRVTPIPPGAVTLIVQCGLMNAAGAVDFDDVVVAPSK